MPTLKGLSLSDAVTSITVGSVLNSVPFAIGSLLVYIVVLVVYCKTVLVLYQGD